LLLLLILLAYPKKRQHPAKPDLPPALRFASGLAACMLRKSKSAAIGSGGLAPAGAIENLLAARFFPFRWKLARACGLLAGFCSLHACVGWCCLGLRCLRGV